MRSQFALSLLATVALLESVSSVQAKEYLPGIAWEEPEVVTPGKTDDQPPSDAIVLFGGKNLDAWENGENWEIEDGVAITQKSGISTKQKFGDCQLHIEWSSPTDSGKSTGQQRGNSGVFFGPYELQVLDSYGHKTYREGQAGAIYKQTPPWVNAMRPPGEWNVYEVIWTAPRFKDDETLESPAYLTAIHNGVLIQNHFKLLGPTPYDTPPKYEHHGKLPISLQYHGNSVRFRNIWVREIKAPVGKRVHPPSFRDGKNIVPLEAEAETAEVSGQIILNGQPLAGGTVFFDGDNGKTVKITLDNKGDYGPSAIEEGRFSVRILGGKGMPAKYGNKQTSGLMAEIQPGANQINFELEGR